MYSFIEHQQQCQWSLFLYLVSEPFSLVFWEQYYGRDNFLGETICK